MPETENVAFGTQRLVLVDKRPVWVPSRALTLVQPWAYLTVAVPDPHRKDVENRATGFVSINFRGPVWIHAGGKLERKQYDLAMRAAAARRMPAAYMPSWDDVRDEKLPGLKRSAIVGRVSISDYLKPTDSTEWGWHFPWHHGFRTESPRDLRNPIACPGHLGFWRISDEVADQLARAILTVPIPAGRDAA
jgi:hypothetical protein